MSLKTISLFSSDRDRCLDIAGISPIRCEPRKVHILVDQALLHDAA